MKEIGIHEVWIRGHSEAKLLDADPAFHSFQDVKHIQTCDVFIALVNKAWHDDERCHAELELARKMHYTSTERYAMRTGPPSLCEPDATDSIYMKQGPSLLQDSLGSHW